MLQMRLIILGTVQRVGFRYSVMKFVESSNLDLFGFVRNLPDGSVEILAQGHLESLKSLHRFASRGPDKAIVREVKEEFSELEEPTYEAFELL